MTKIGTALTLFFLPGIALAQAAPGIPPSSIFGGFEILAIFFLVLIVFGIAFWIWALFDCLTKESSSGNNKIVWLLVILFLGIIGAIIYAVVRRPQRLLEGARP